MQIPHPNWLGALAVRIHGVFPELSAYLQEFASQERANNDAIQRALGDSIPTGAILAWATATAPSGWLICDGATITAAEYPALHAITGDTLPNLKGRVVVGLDASQTEFDTLEETGGAKTHTLTTAEIPSHAHTISANPPYGITLSNPFADGPNAGSNTNFGVTNASTTTQNAGGGGAHNNLQPYIVLNYIIKT